MLIKNCSYVVTQNNDREILENIDILIQGTTIIKIGKNLNSKKNDVVISGKNKMVMPGLVNTHTHIGMHSLRGICDDEELPAWLDKVISAEKKFTAKQIQQNAESACKEMLRFGTTTFCEMYHPIEPVLAGVKKYPIRSVLCPVLYDFLGTIDQQFETAKRLILKKHSPLITMGLGIHSIYACNQKMMIEAKQFARKHNLLTPIHIAETRKERFEVQDKYQRLPVDYLESFDFLDENTLLVHAIWLTKNEVRVIGKCRSKVSHCPISNMKLASGGTMPLMEMFENNVVVGLGTDSVASNNNMNLFEEMKVTGLLHKYHRWQPSCITNQQIIDMATINGAKALSLDKEIGSIEVGKKADIIMLEIGLHLHPIYKENVLSHLVYAASGYDITDVLVDGKAVLRDREFVETNRK
ncbi:amidohydrolase [Candidatus Woesearchaeota archaeon]|nr:amidohydrolase [Candidatus Woesearchaeota archaeon]